MNGRRFIELARRSRALRREENWHDAVSRAYYGLMLECREALRRWGFVFPKCDIHRAVRLRYDSPTFPLLSAIGFALDQLGQWRSKADYDLTAPIFATDARAVTAVGMAEQALVDLDALDSDAVERAAAIADIQSRFP
jgi:hypothetical protein